MEMEMSDSEEWIEIPSQITAITGFVGILAGLLRAKGVISSVELDQVFALTAGLLPEEPDTLGAETLAAIRGAARGVAAPD